jgi:hypothetical protein
MLNTFADIALEKIKAERDAKLMHPRRVDVVIGRLYQVTRPFAIAREEWPTEVEIDSTIQAVFESNADLDIEERDEWLPAVMERIRNDYFGELLEGAFAS